METKDKDVWHSLPRVSTYLKEVVMSNNELSTFHIKQVETEIDSLFSNLIDMSDYDSKRNNEKQIAFKSRALAAYSLYILAGITPNQAALAIVDGFDDNGIDALLFQRKQNILWLVQSKWIQSGNKSPQAADMRTFKDGVFDLLDFSSIKLERFNYKFESKEDEIKSALISPGLKIKAVIAFTGDKLSNHSRNVLDDLIQELNDCEDIAAIEVFNLESAFQAVHDRHRQEDIEVDFELSDWGRVDEPYQAFYGQINAETIGRWWIQYKNRLFAQNIREFLGDSEVNDDILQTLDREPALFWYFNNGITVLCKEITKVGAKKDRKIGDFIAKGITIVNGAQTIGCIGAFYQNNLPEVREKIGEVEVSIRFISLKDCEEDFSLKLTRANNTQNRVENRDFIALDHQQERLGKEFKTCGKKYHYKRTAEAITRDDKNYELEEATVALACASRDINLVMTAKQELSKLWSDPNSPPYTTLFNSHVNALKLYRQIEVKRQIEELIKPRKEKANDRLEIALLNHANLFILHLIFQKIPKAVFEANESERNFSLYKTEELEILLDKILNISQEYLKEKYRTGQIWNLFRSAKKSKELRATILQKC